MRLLLEKILIKNAALEKNAVLNLRKQKIQS